MRTRVTKLSFYAIGVVSPHSRPKRYLSSLKKPPSLRAAQWRGNFIGHLGKMLKLLHFVAVFFLKFDYELSDPLQERSLNIKAKLPQTGVELVLHSLTAL